MSSQLKRRMGLTIFFLFLSFFYLAPTLTSQLPAWWKSPLPQEKVHLGLDLQGGSQLMLAVKTEVAVAGYLDRLATEVEDDLVTSKSTFKRISRTDGNELQLLLYDLETATSIQDRVKKAHPDLDVSMPAEISGVFPVQISIPAKTEQELKDRTVLQALETIRNRIDQFGVAEPLVQREGADHIVVQLPGIKDPQRAIELIGKTALLEFKLLADNVDPATPAASLPSNVQILMEKRVDSQGIEVGQTPLAVEKRAVITGDLLKDARVRMDTRTNSPYVSITFDSAGARIFDQVTAANVGKRFAIVLDNTIYSAPVIRERIAGGSAQISGSFSAKEAADLAIVLRAGSLPAPVEIIQNVTVGPSLGLDSIHKGLMAGAVGVLVVMLFMAIYYRFAGLVANIGLVLNILLLMGVLAALGATLTLPGIAAIVLLVGMSVDANVLIFERIKEELQLGKTPGASLSAGYDKAFLTIMDSHVTTLITAAVLFQFGTGPVKGFAVSLSLGILINLFTSLVTTRIIFDLVHNRFRLKSRSFGGTGFALLQNLHINFIGKRALAFLLSATIVLTGLVGMIQISRGAANLGTDFTGGTSVQLKFNQPPSLDAAREILARHGLKEATLQEIHEGNKLQIKVGKSYQHEGSVADAIKSSFSKEMPDNGFVVESSSEIGPSIGHKLKQDTLVAVAISLFGILCYVGWRFDLKFAVGALAATLHDVLAMFAVFFLMGKEINLLFITAVLTIAGYSLTDTVVVFDRTRENLRKRTGEPLETVFNRSLNEVFSRTIVTSLTTFLAAAALYCFGGEVIHDFAFALVVGVVIATYSSIFVASPVVVEWCLRTNKTKTDTPDTEAQTTTLKAAR